MNRLFLRVTGYEPVDTHILRNIALVQRCSRVAAALQHGHGSGSGHDKTPPQGRGFDGGVTATAAHLSRLDCTATQGSAVQSYAGFCTVSPELSGSPGSL